MELIVTIVCKKEEAEEVRKIIDERKLRVIKTDETNSDLNFYTFKPSTKIGAEMLMAFEG